MRREQMVKVEVQHQVNRVQIRLDHAVGWGADDLALHIEQTLPQNGVDDDDGAVSLVEKAEMPIGMARP